MKKTIFVFSSIILAIFLLLKLSSYSLHSGRLDLEIGIGLIALVFFFVGLWIQKQSKVKSNSDHEIDKDKIAALEISKREYEVLRGIAEGLSNKEIGDRLFLSESTIKTHVSSLLLKLNAKRRTQALQIAKSHKII